MMQLVKELRKNEQNTTRNTVHFIAQVCALFESAASMTTEMKNTLGLRALLAYTMPTWLREAVHQSRDAFLHTPPPVDFYPSTSAGEDAEMVGEDELDASCRKRARDEASSSSSAKRVRA